MNNENKKKRVVVAMSGGVDSSVAAALLVEQGYEVIGMMMRLWSEPGQSEFNKCCTPDQLADARRMADQLGIPFYAVDVKDYFRKTIVQYFIDQYAEGNTPNPCVECNRNIRFGFLLDQARALDADYLATGHYAKIRHTEENGYELWQGDDPKKDQSYVLHVMGQEELAQTLFPCGEYTKPEVRELAKKFNLPVASKSDSMDLCFLGNDSYKGFLERNAPDIAQEGSMQFADGTVVGKHTGLPFYTIGQRKGLGIAHPVPLYVVGKDIENNTLIVGPKEDLGQDSIKVTRVNWLNHAPTEPTRIEVKTRYKSASFPCTVIPTGEDTAIIEFDTPLLGVASGQSAVFYDGMRCLGGGIIVRNDAVTVSADLVISTGKING